MGAKAYQKLILEYVNFEMSIRLISRHVCWAVSSLN